MHQWSFNGAHWLGVRVTLGTRNPEVFACIKNFLINQTTYVNMSLEMPWAHIVGWTETIHQTLKIAIPQYTLETRCMDIE